MTPGSGWRRMSVAHTRQSFVAIGVIHAAAEQVRIEHGLDTAWFFSLARSSDFVPAHRERSFARGLASGLRGDYELAAILLCPQFEHAVRELFFRRGIVTSTLPSSGAQNEHNLNQLFEHPRAVEVFGEDLLFDLRVLLTEKAGANLRNDIAHGLLDDGDKSGAKIYFWWICLRFVLLPVLQAPIASAGRVLDPRFQRPKRRNRASLHRSLEIVRRLIATYFSTIGPTMATTYFGFAGSGRSDAATIWTVSPGGIAKFNVRATKSSQNVRRLK